MVFAEVKDETIAPLSFASGKLGVIRDAAAILALAACILALAVGSYNPFIYFRF